MTTIFSRIIAGEIPGTFVYRDDRCVAFMSINPLARGHVLVVPIEESITGSTHPQISSAICSTSPSESARPSGRRSTASGSV